MFIFNINLRYYTIINVDKNTFLQFIFNYIYMRTNLFIHIIVTEEASILNYFYVMF